MSAQESLAGLLTSENIFAAGIGECIRAISSMIAGPLESPVVVEFGPR
jgi:hypothetical protein